MTTATLPALNGRIIGALKSEESARDCLRKIGGDELLAKFQRFKNTPVTTVTAVVEFLTDGQSGNSLIRRYVYETLSYRDVFKYCIPSEPNAQYRGAPTYLTWQACLLLVLTSPSVKGLTLRAILKHSADHSLSCTRFVCSILESCGLSTAKRNTNAKPVNKKASNGSSKKVEVEPIAVEEPVTAVESVEDFEPIDSTVPVVASYDDEDIAKLEEIFSDAQLLRKVRIRSQATLNQCNKKLSEIQAKIAKVQNAITRIDLILELGE